MINIKELRRLAQAATPGGWYVARGNYVYGCNEVTDGEEEWPPVIACTDDDEVSINFEENAKFIAAVNPAVVDDLLDRLEAAEKDIALKERIIDSLGLTLNSVASERDALLAKIAEMEKQEPVKFEYRWKDTSPNTVTSDQYTQWMEIAPRNIHTDTVQDRVAEIQRYIDKGYAYEIRVLYLAPGAKGE